MPEPSQITVLLNQLNSGKDEALEQLMPLVYDELRGMARQQLRFERQGHTIQPTALVNEAYLKLINQHNINANHRTQFLMIAGQMMRRVLVDYARKHKRKKRGGGIKPVPLEVAEEFLSDKEAQEVLSLDDALERLEKVDPRAAKVVECRFYAGMSLSETAEVLNVSTKTVQRDWLAARAWLRKEVTFEISP